MPTADSDRPSVKRKRPYRLQRRAEKQAKTRQRIVEAAIELHGTIGVRATTMSAIAERAGVQRNTLYSHFPNEFAVGRACSRLWAERNPGPDPRALARIAESDERLRAAIRGMHAYFDRTQGMLANVARDSDHPVVAEAAPRFRDEGAARCDVVVRGFGLRGARRERLSAAVHVALDFETWRLLVQRRGMEADAAVDLLARMVRAAL